MPIQFKVWGTTKPEYYYHWIVTEQVPNLDTSRLIDVSCNGYELKYEKLFFNDYRKTKKLDYQSFDSDFLTKDVIMSFYSWLKDNKDLKSNRINNISFIFAEQPNNPIVFRNLDGKNYLKILDTWFNKQSDIEFQHEFYSYSFNRSKIAGIAYE